MELSSTFSPFHSTVSAHRYAIFLCRHFALCLAEISQVIQLTRRMAAGTHAESGSRVHAFTPQKKLQTTFTAKMICATRKPKKARNPSSAGRSAADWLD